MEALAAITANAAQHITWSLTILGATLLTVVGTSHVSPNSTLGRSVYLLFLPAWVLLGASIYYGDRVHRHAISTLMVGEDKRREIFGLINADALCQLNLMRYAGVFLAFWLLAYVLWWVFFRGKAE